MSTIRNISIAPRAFLGFSLIALLVIALGVFSMNRMTLIRQATIDMETNMLPSIVYLGDVQQNTLYLRIAASRMVNNRDPAQLQQMYDSIPNYMRELKTAKDAYGATPAGEEEKATFAQFN